MSSEKPDWCPADVWAQVRDINLILPYQQVQELIVHAILAERERALEEAAKQADNFGWGYSDQGTEGNYRREHVACAHVAAAIRALKETP